MTSQDEITRTADRLRDALGAAADVMAAGAGPVHARRPRAGHAWMWLLPLTAAASALVIAGAAMLAGHPAGSPQAVGPFTRIYGDNGQAAQ